MTIQLRMGFIKTSSFIVLVILLCTLAAVSSEERNNDEEVFLRQLVEPASWEIDEDLSLGSMLLFQYLVNFLEGDILPCNSLHEGSRKLNCEGLVRDCLAIRCGRSQIQSAFSNHKIYPENSVAKPPDNCDTTVAIALPEIGKKTCIAMQKLLRLIMELDKLKKKAEMQGYTTRADGVRTPLVEIILDELTYNSEILSPFLQVFNEPKWKLEIILQYFWQYTAKPSIRTRRSNGSSDDATFSGALKCFPSSTSTKVKRHHKKDWYRSNSVAFSTWF